MMNDSVHALLNSDFSFFLIVGAIVVVVVAISTVGSIIKNISRERTRREIAAYIAEGSMTPEQGERLMKAGNKEDE